MTLFDYQPLFKDVLGAPKIKEAWMICPDCHETMEGDGYKTVLHCPNADVCKVEIAEPDANPVYCGLNLDEPRQGEPDVVDTKGKGNRG